MKSTPSSSSPAIAPGSAGGRARACLSGGSNRVAARLA